MCDELDRMELDDSDKLFGLQDTLESQVSVKIKKLLAPACTPSEASTPPSESKGVRLPKLDVPTFDGNILNWRSFWEQFRISVHDRTHLSDSEKLFFSISLLGVVLLRALLRASLVLANVIVKPLSV